MYDIKLIAVGKLKEAYMRNLEEEYKKQIAKRHKLTVVEVPDESIPKNGGDGAAALVKFKEGSKIRENIGRDDYVIALAIDGRITDSKMLSQIVRTGTQKKEGKIVFVIGGSLGLEEQILERADIKISFSKMTFPHQLMRVMLLEQMAAYL